MSRLNPKGLFERLASDVPAELHAHLYVAGSLAAAYHFEAELEGRAVNTKDADVVVHPAGNNASSRDLAMQLLSKGWSPLDTCRPRARPEPVETLSAIRL